MDRPGVGFIDVSSCAAQFGGKSLKDIWAKCLPNVVVILGVC